jgi:hypothetical protein
MIILQEETETGTERIDRLRVDMMQWRQRFEMQLKPGALIRERRTPEQREVADIISCWQELGTPGDHDDLGLQFISSLVTQSAGWFMDRQTAVRLIRRHALSLPEWGRSEAPFALMIQTYVPVRGD